MCHARKGSLPTLALMAAASVLFSAAYAPAHRIGAVPALRRPLAARVPPALLDGSAEDGAAFSAAAQLGREPGTCDPYDPKSAEYCSPPEPAPSSLKRTVRLGVLFFLWYSLNTVRTPPPPSRRFQRRCRWVPVRAHAARAAPSGLQYRQQARADGLSDAVDRRDLGGTAAKRHAYKQTRGRASLLRPTQTESPSPTVTCAATALPRLPILSALLRAVSSPRSSSLASRTCFFSGARGCARRQRSRSSRSSCSRRRASCWPTRRPYFSCHIIPLFLRHPAGRHGARCFFFYGGVVLVSRHPAGGHARRRRHLVRPGRDLLHARAQGNRAGLVRPHLCARLPRRCPPPARGPGRSREMVRV